jgi:hypothetical protein
MTSTTATLHELQHDFAAIEKAAARGPVKITRQGRVVGTFTAETTPAAWTPPDRSTRSIKLRAPLDVRDYLG